MLKSVNELVKEYNGSIVLVDKRLKSLSSKKCNLNKNRMGYSDKDFNNLMNDVLFEMEELRKVKELINGKKVVNFLDYSEEEIKELSFDDIEKGIRSLSSIKCRNRCDIKKVEEIEEKELIYKKYKEINKSSNLGYVKKSEVIKVIKLIEEMKKISKNEMLELLNNMIKDIM